MTVSLPPTDERFRALRGEGLEKAQQGALREAAGLFMRALDLRPTDAETWNSLGVVLVRQGQAARGVDAFNHALHLNPNHLEAHRNLAVTLDRQGRSGEAAVHYRAFLRLTQEDHPARDDVRGRLLDLSAAGSNPE
jgi:Flp pilus assembly protein TadD